MKRRWIAMLLGAALLNACILWTSAADQATLPFADVTKNSWFYAGVRYVYSHGLMKGVNDDSFDPNGATTRGMVITILHRLEGSPVPEKACTFADVKSGSYYEQAVTWGAENSIVNGYSREQFDPDGRITREQMAAILFRYALLKNYDMSPQSDLSGFSDYTKVGSYAIAALSWANGAGLINGTSTTTISPDGTATRAQSATILARFCEQFEETGKTREVRFSLNYANAGLYQTQSIRQGSSVSMPADPVRDGFIFGGWHTAAFGGERFDFTRTISENTTLYAYWTAISTGGSSAGGIASVAETYEVVEAATADQTAKNVFLLETAQTENVVELVLSLGGTVSLCGFDVRVLYDSNAVTLSELNASCDLEAYADASQPGTIAVNFSAAKNVRKGGTVLKATFAPSGMTTETVFSIEPVEIIKVNEQNDIIQAEYALTYCKALLPYPQEG